MTKLFRSTTGRAGLLRALAALVLLAGGLALTASAAEPATPRQTPTPRPEKKKKLKAGSDFERYAERDASNRLIAGGATRGVEDPCASTQPSLINECGLKHYQAGENAEAIKAFSQLVKLRPDSAVTHRNLAAAYEAAGQWKEAAAEYQAVLRIVPDHAESLYNLANVYAQLGQFDEAVKANEHVARLAPDQSVAHYNLGMSYAKAGQTKEAIDSFKKAILIKSDYESAHYNLGVAYLKGEMYEEAQAAFKEAVRLKPDDADAVYRLGLTRLLLTDVGPEALDEYKTLKTLKPELAEQLKKEAEGMKTPD